MLNPHEPEVDGIKKVEHDGRPDEAHEEEVRRADGGRTIKEEDEHEQGHAKRESDPEPKSAKEEEDEY